MYWKIFIIMIIGIVVISCGKPTVSVGHEQYEPKISIEAYLIPGHPADNFNILRNFSASHNIEDLRLPDAVVKLISLNEGTVHTLNYLPRTGYFEYMGEDLTIDYGKSYRLNVEAVIEGKKLNATSSTTVPNQGLKIISINYDSLNYRQRDANGNIMNFKIEFERSPGTDFYLATIYALDADVSTFVYDNPFYDGDEEDVHDDLADLMFNINWVQDTPLNAGVSNMELFWYDLSFYGRYQVVIYATDKNYRDFISTFNEVQEDDGNFHEPLLHIDGDGIGVFGSAVTDTIYFEVKER